MRFINAVAWVGLGWTSLGIILIFIGVIVSKNPRVRQTYLLGWQRNGWKLIGVWMLCALWLMFGGAP